MLLFLSHFDAVFPTINRDEPKQVEVYSERAPASEDPLQRHRHKKTQSFLWVFKDLNFTSSLVI